MDENEKRIENENQDENEKPIEVPSLELLEAELKHEQAKSLFFFIIRNTILCLVAVAAAAVLIIMLVAPILRITGTSMAQTFKDGDIVVAVKGVPYEKGDIIAFYHNNNILVKRLIAEAGDWVDIDEEGTVYVNSEMLEEPYVYEKSLGECDISFPYQVPSGKCFVLGDHRSTSIDSRSSEIGCVSNNRIVGRVVLRIVPLTQMKLVQ